MKWCPLIELSACPSLCPLFGRFGLIEALQLTVAHMESVITEIKINYCMFLQLREGLLWIVSVGLVCTNHFYCRSKRLGEKNDSSTTGGDFLKY